MSENGVNMQIITLESPIHCAGLSLKNSGLPMAFESLGLLWDRFHKEVLPGLEHQVQPPVEVAVCTVSDYLVGSQTAEGRAFSELTEFAIPPGPYLKAEFSANDFSQLVDQVLPNLWPKVEAWAKERGVVFDNGGLCSVEVYPQETVTQPRPSMYCLYPVKPS